MSFSTFTMTVSPPPIVPKVKLLKSAALPLQNPLVQKTYPIDTASTISRRDMALCLTTATLAGANPAEARVVKPEIRKKIMEKLKLLRENANLLKQKAESGENTTPPQNQKELSFPELPNSQ